MELPFRICARPSAIDTAIRNAQARASWSNLCPHSPFNRPRVDCDELITPTQSVTAVGSLTSLTEKATLSARSSASRSSSPQRQITQLRTAHPPMNLHPLGTAGEYVSAAVFSRIRALRTRLRHRPGREYIPTYQRDALEHWSSYCSVQ